jgi:hypothetical protein
LAAGIDHGKARFARAPFDDPVNWDARAFPVDREGRLVATFVESIVTPLTGDHTAAVDRQDLIEFGSVEENRKYKMGEVLA